MTKEIQITDGQYDWLMARGKWKREIRSVISDVIRLIDLMEKDREKYRAWMGLSEPGFKAVKREETEDPENAGEERG